MNEEEMTRKKLAFFQDHNVAIHLVRTDGRFFNGKVLEITTDHLILDDEKLGALPIYFIEIRFFERRGPKNVI